MLERGCGGSKAQGIGPAAILEARGNQRPAECIAGTDAVDNLHFVPRGTMELTFGK